MSAEICFDTYLSSLVSAYQQWGRLYTLTDATGRKSQLDRAEPSEFLDLGLMVQSIEPPKSDQDSKSGQEKEKKEEVKRFPVLEGICKYAADHVLLVGRPGSGKSTALARLLLQEAEIALEDRLAKIPVLVELRYLPSEANESSVCDRIRAFMLKHDPELQLDVAAVENLLRQGRLLLLVDGVNELPSDRSRHQVNKFRQDYQKTCPMIFTTRELIAGGDLGIARQLEMQPLTESQMQKFVMAYLPTLGEKLLQQLSGRLREFGQTPLLLWMLCLLFRQTEQIPPNLGTVFRAFTKTYEKESVRNYEVDVFKGSIQPLSDSSLWKDALKHLASKMMQGSSPVDFRVVISKDEILQEFKILFKDEPYPPKLARDCLDDLLKYHLIQVDNEDKVEFRHQLIQEYYAAEWLLGLLPSLSDARLQHDYLNYLKWTEPLALMLDLVEDSDPLRVVELALEVDLQLGARLAGSVKQEFQKKAIELVENLKTTMPVKVSLLEKTHSNHAFNGLREALNHPESNIRGKAAWASRKMPYDVCISLSKIALEDSDPQVRAIVIRALRESKNEIAVSILNTVLQKDSSADVRQEVVYALKEFENEESIFSLIRATEDREHNIRESAFYALEKLDRQKVIDTISGALSKRDMCLKICVIKMLRKLGGEAVIPYLSKAALDLEQKVYLEAKTSLQFVKDQIASEVQKKKEVACIDLELQKKSEIEKVTAQLRATNPVHRGNAIQSLGHFMGRDAIPIVIEALGDSNTYVQFSACNILAARLIDQFPEEVEGLSKAIPKLIRIFENEDSYSYAQAASALGKLNDKIACTSLLKAIRDKNPSTRINALTALVHLGCQEVNIELLKALKDPDPLVKSFAVEFLGERQCKEAISDLIILLKDTDILVQSSVSEALSHFQGDIAAKYLPQLVELISTNIGENSLGAIAAIQARCKYYNYDIAQTPLQEETKLESVRPLTIEVYSPNATVIGNVDGSVGIYPKPP
jgi:HEAT repeat protein